MSTKTFLQSLLTLGALAVTAPSFALSVDLNLTDPDSREDPYTEVRLVRSCWFWFCSYSTEEYESPYYAMEYNYHIDELDVGLTVQGFSYNSNSTIESDWVGNWANMGSYGQDYGLGIEYAESPNHAIDNSNSDFDMLLLAFDQEVNLEAISSGWRGNGYNYSSGTAANSEASLMAFTGDLASADSFEGKQWQDLLGLGWESAGDTRIQNLNTATDVNAGGLTSRFWLVGAYNQNLGGTSGFSAGNDFFKLNGISIDVNPVPLPGSLILFGTSLIAFGSLRRKAKK